MWWFWSGLRWCDWEIWWRELGDLDPGPWASPCQREWGWEELGLWWPEDWKGGMRVKDEEWERSEREVWAGFYLGFSFWGVWGIRWYPLFVHVCANSSATNNAKTTEFRLKNYSNFYSFLVINYLDDQDHRHSTYQEYHHPFFFIILLKFHAVKSMLVGQRAQNFKIEPCLFWYL